MTRHYGTPVKLDDLEATAVLAQQALRGDGDEVGVLFRVEAVRYSGCQLTEWGGEDYYITDPRLEVHAYWVHKWTEHGATIRGGYERTYTHRRWVDLRPDAKQWASRTLPDAIMQFAARRRRQIYILNRQLLRANHELALTAPFVVAIVMQLFRLLGTGGLDGCLVSSLAAPPQRRTQRC